ncbi:MAG: acetyltransferase [Bryobacteraceae bacterium]
MSVRSAWLVCCGALLAAMSPLAAQEPMPGETPGAMVHLFSTDGAVLESQEARKDLPCTVTPNKPALGFDLKFHAGYEVGVPLKDLAGDGNQLTMVFRVIPEGHADDPVYFAQHVPVPPLDDVDRGPAFLLGAFDVGEGKYHIDWLMRDRAERVCSFHWDAEAALPPRDRQIALDIAAGAVRQFDTEAFKPEPPVARDLGGLPLKVKVIVNFAPQNSAAAALQPMETSALLSILRGIAREPRIVEFSLVAFNLQEQKVIYRQQEASQIDFPGLGKALRALNLGTTDLKRLAQKHPGSEFLAGLISTEVSQAKDSPDAVIFAGPRLGLEDTIPAEELKQLSDVKFPVFYMSYNLNPATNPWRDAIGSAVKYLKGMEFTISRPRDLFFAWNEIMGRILKGKSGATVAGNAPSH